MSDPEAPDPPDPSPRPSRSGQPGAPLDPDGSNIFGPDAPNVRSDDPSWGQPEPEAPPPSPPTASPDELDFAPDGA
jgi:hypothetical protein